MVNDYFRATRLPEIMSTANTEEEQENFLAGGQAARLQTILCDWSELLCQAPLKKSFPGKEAAVRKLDGRHQTRSKTEPISS